MPCSDVVAFPPIAQPEGFPIGSEFFHPPPLAFNMYADYLGNYVREKKYLSLEEAVRKATSLPAELLGIKDRGVLDEGVFADLVVFDFEKIRADIDFRKPAQPPEGIEYVLVNGQLVYEKKVHTGLKPGNVLRRE
jgi:N-acyl-D-aspartate/D-glutamate deacylase